MTNYHYLTCDELLLKYRGEIVLWGWNTARIGVFYRCLLLDGRKFGKRSRTLVGESSFEKLMSYTRSNTHIDPGDDFVTYEEIMELFPEALFYRWNPTVIGIMCSSHLLIGKYSNKETRKMVSVSSAIRLIKYTNGRFEEIITKRSFYDH